MVATILSVGQWLLANYALVLHAVLAVLTALVALFMIIPGPQPEAALQKVVDFIERFSKK